MTRTKVATAWTVMILALPTIVAARICISETGWLPPRSFEAGLTLLDQYHTLIPMLLCGGALALAGLFLQTIFRQPLTSPFTLGLCSSANFGLAAAQIATIHCGLWWAQPPYAPLWAWASCCCCLMVLTCGKLSRHQPIVLGIAITILTSFACLWLTPAQTPAEVATLWLGEVHPLKLQTLLQSSSHSWELPLTLAVTLIFALCWAHWRHIRLQSLLLPDNESKALGSHPTPTRILLALFCSVLIAGAVSLCGPIAFVGLVAPNLARRIQKSHQRSVALTSILCGCLLLLTADLICALHTWLIPSATLPYGVTVVLLCIAVGFALVRNQKN